MSQTVIGSAMVIEGEISGDEGVVVQGTIKGKIATKQAVQIENSAHVEADIETSALTVSGHLKGNVLAREKVEVTSAGRVIGDLKTPRIFIADGAAFRGKIDMEM